MLHATEFYHLALMLVTAYGMAHLELKQGLGRIRHQSRYEKTARSGGSASECVCCRNNLGEKARRYAQGANGNGPAGIKKHISQSRRPTKYHTKAKLALV